MAKSKKTPKESLKYWRVGPKGLKIKARTARVAARKYLRNNAAHDFVVQEYEMTRDHGSHSGKGVEEMLSQSHVKEFAKEYMPRLEDIRVEPWEET